MINMLTDKYKVFHMEHGEIMESMHHFLHLIDKLDNLRKSLSNKYYANKKIKIYLQGMAIEGYSH